MGPREDKYPGDGIFYQHKLEMEDYVWKRVSQGSLKCLKILMTMPIVQMTIVWISPWQHKFWKISGLIVQEEKNRGITGPNDHSSRLGESGEDSFNTLRSSSLRRNSPKLFPEVWFNQWGLWLINGARFSLQKMKSMLKEFYILAIHDIIYVQGNLYIRQSLTSTVFWVLG